MTRLPLGRARRVHEYAVGAGAREYARYPRVTAGPAVVIDDRGAEVRPTHDQHRIELVRREIDRDRASRRGGELVVLEVAVVGVERVAAGQRAVDRFAHADRRRGRPRSHNLRARDLRAPCRAVVLAAALHGLAALADREREAPG